MIHLNPRQKVVLKALASLNETCEWCSIVGLVSEVRNIGDCEALEDEQGDVSLNAVLAAFRSIPRSWCLVGEKEIKGMIHFQITEDGKLEAGDL